MLYVECQLNKETNVVSGQCMPDVATFGKAFSANITQYKKNGIGNWTYGQILYLL
jgi:hypothetical protein